jgi:hypothetical protein
MTAGESLSQQGAEISPQKLKQPVSESPVHGERLSQPVTESACLRAPHRQAGPGAVELQPVAAVGKEARRNHRFNALNDSTF